MLNIAHSWLACFEQWGGYEHEEKPLHPRWDSTGCAIPCQSSTDLPSFPSSMPMTSALSDYLISSSWHQLCSRQALFSSTRCSRALVCCWHHHIAIVTRIMVQGHSTLVCYHTSLRSIRRTILIRNSRIYAILKHLGVTSDDVDDISEPFVGRAMLDDSWR